MTASAPASAKSSYFIELATRSDEAGLRELLRNNPVPGAISVTFEREPHFFYAAQTQGAFHQVCIARYGDEIIGMGTRAIAGAYLNGIAGPLGYLSDLRLKAEHRCGTLVGRGYRFLRELHQDARTKLYHTVIFSQNEVALRTLASGRARLPQYHNCGLIHCPGINLQRNKPELRGNFEIVRGSPALLPEIVACLNRNNQRKQFAPVHRIEDFLPGGRWLDFEVEDLYVALHGGRVVGVIGKWDQRKFKQTRVCALNGCMQFLQPVTEMVRPLFGTPRVPKIGEYIAYFFASFIAIDCDDLDVFRALLRRLYNDSVNSGFSYFLVGLHERDPLLQALEDYSLTPFLGRLFCVCFEDGERAFRSLDSRTPFIEIGTL